jgi:hypothetical protein
LSGRRRQVEVEMIQRNERGAKSETGESKGETATIKGVSPEELLDGESRPCGGE